MGEERGEWIGGREREGGRGEIGREGEGREERKEGRGGGRGGRGEEGEGREESEGM